MVHFSYFLLLCVLLPLMIDGGILPKGRRYSINTINDKVYYFSNDISILPYLRMGRSGSRSLKQTLPVNLEMEAPSRPCPASRQVRTASSMNMYHIGDFRFSVPTKTGAGILKRKVLAECGFLLGLDDFVKVPPFDEPQDVSGLPELWFRWNRLGAKCQISTVLDELKEGKGDATVLVKPLYMLVRVPSKEPSLSEIEMTKAKEVTVSFNGLEDLPAEAVQEISSNIEFQFTCLVNNEIRDILKDSMKSSIEKQKSENLTKLIFERGT